MMKVFNEPSEIASKDSGLNQLNSSDIKRKREKKHVITLKLKKKILHLHLAKFVSFLLPHSKLDFFFLMWKLANSEFSN